MKWILSIQCKIFHWFCKIRLTLSLKIMQYFFSQARRSLKISEFTFFSKTFFAYPFSWCRRWNCMGSMCRFWSRTSAGIQFRILEKKRKNICHIFLGSFFSLYKKSLKKNSQLSPNFNAPLNLLNCAYLWKLSIVLSALEI